MQAWTIRPGNRRTMRAALLLAGVAATGLAAAGGEGQAAGSAPAISEAFLEDPANIAAGGELWEQQCRHCHGRSAYPGKAPKLKPRKYTPEFVYDRVANGFRKMPPWKDVYSEEQLQAIVAYVLSREFSP